MDAGCSSSPTYVKGENIYTNVVSHFYGNTCHVCKQYGKPLFTCKCKMISYCCVKHEEQYMNVHHELCNIIVKEQQYVMQNSTIYFENTEDWKMRKKQLLLSVESELNRPLCLDEREMFLFPSNCMICHKQNDLHHCSKCPSVSLCQFHAMTDARFNHCCDLYRLCFEVDILGYCGDVNYLKCLPSRIVYHDDENGSFNFFHRYIKPVLKIKMDTVQLAIHTQFITQPLTLLYAAKQINYDFNRNDLYIHIIATNFTLENIKNTWEILFHYEPTLKCLNIMIIGENSLSSSADYNLCSTCLNNKKEMLFSVHSMYYGDYVISSDFIKPDLIVMYNPRIYMREMKYQNDAYPISILKNVYPSLWTLNIILLILYFKCPFILTSYTTEDAMKDTEIINNITDKRMVCHIYAKPNPFVSLRPYRDPETELPVFQNSFVSVYK